MVTTTHKFRYTGKLGRLMSANTHNKAFITIALR